MVSRDANDEYRGLVNELRVQLIVTESCLRSMKSGVQKKDSGALGKDLASTPVTASAITSASAKVRYLTRRVGREFPYPLGSSL